MTKGKPLHEKKISELPTTSVMEGPDEGKEMVYLFNLKQWAIAVVKEELDNKIGLYFGVGTWKQAKKITGHTRISFLRENNCHVSVLLIERLEITEEELK